MKRPRTTGVLAVLGALLVVVLGATAAAAQKPVKVTETVSDSFEDTFLTEACGVRSPPPPRPDYVFNFPIDRSACRT